MTEQTFSCDDWRALFPAGSKAPARNLELPPAQSALAEYLSSCSAQLDDRDIAPAECLVPGFASFLGKVGTGEEGCCLFISVQDENKGRAVAAHVLDALDQLPNGILKWCLPVSQHILVNSSDRDTLNSGSSLANLMSYRISENSSVSATQEMIVHECSHQYYYLKVALEAVSKPDAPEVYSALKQCNRPLERVLFALHAATNIATLYRSIKADNQNAKKQALSDQLQLIKTISDNRQNFTPYGQTLAAAVLDHAC